MQPATSITAVLMPTATDRPFTPSSVRDGSAPATTMASMPLTIMTFNLRFASDQPPNAWPDRRPVVAQTVSAVAPDVIGTQEGLAHQISDIAADCPAYAGVGIGRDADGGGETATVFYRHDRLTVLDHGHLWLSDTPDVAGSRTWGNTLPRMATWVRFHDHESDGDLYLLNTHLDHESAVARVRGAALICAQAAELDPALPIVVTGDFNADAGADPTYDVFLDAGFADLRLTAEQDLGPAYGSFHGYEDPVPDGPHIDWILGRGPITPRSFRLVDTQQDGQRPSDHFPLAVTVELRG